MQEDLDFESLSEEPEKLDFNNMVPCPQCNKPIPHDATMCLYCGEEVAFSKKPAWVVWTAIAIIIMFTVLLLAST